MSYFFETIFKIINRRFALKFFIATIAVIFALYPIEICGYQSDNNKVGIIAVRNLNMRPKPDRKNAPLNVLKKGTKVQILEHCDKWLKISYNGKIGYIRNSERYVSFIDKKNDAKLQSAKKQSESVINKIKKQEAKIVKQVKQENLVINGLNEIDIRLDNIRKRVSKLRSELALTEKKINEISVKSQRLSEKIETSKEYASKRLIALYKFAQLGEMHVCVEAESVYDFFYAKKSLKRIVDYDENLVKSLIQNKKKLQRLLKAQRARQKEKFTLTADLKEQIGIASYEKTKRKKLLADVRNKKSLQISAIKSLRQTALNLDQTIKFLISEINKSKQLKKIKAQVFDKLILMPVKGKIVSFFGPCKKTNLNIKTFQNGIKIKADRGEPIQAVRGGQLIYANWFKGYGNMIIIDHGGNYCTVYAHIEELFKTKGDEVETGEVIATVGDTGSMTGPELYFEVRHHGKPVNPLKLIKKG